VLIYVYKPNALQIQQDWRHYLGESGEAAKVWDGQTDLVFYSSVAHAGTGRPLEFRHVPFPLYHVPTEKDPKPPRSRGRGAKSEQPARRERLS
jgi:hypothetical protein